MIPSQEQISNWITAASDFDASNDIIDCPLMEFIDKPALSFRRFIIEMRCQIDRWDLVMQFLFVHPQIMRMFTTYLKNEINVPFYNTSGINRPITNCELWGTQIEANSYLPEDTLIGFTEVENASFNDNRNLVVGKLNLTLLNRLNQVKAFW